jgi:hypothetical protein
VGEFNMAMFQAPGDIARLGSEEIIVAAPLSFAGASKRLFRFSRRWGGGTGRPAWLDVVAALFLIVALPLVWAFILAWYLAWGLWLVPYRLIRRGSRKEKKRALQHREMLNQMQAQSIATHTAIAAQMQAQAAMSSPPTAGAIPAAPEQPAIESR